MYMYATCNAIKYIFYVTQIMIRNFFINKFLLLNENLNYGTYNSV